jgi:ATP-dependent Clp protease ATP-binding subunit ClpC
VFERFSDEARRVLVLAQEAARLLGHSFIGTEHLLLALLDEGKGPAAKALTSSGLSSEIVREKVNEHLGPAGVAAVGSPPFTPSSKKVLELALREALQLGHNYIGTEHLLLGIIRQGQGAAFEVLVGLGTDMPRLRQKVIDILSVHGDEFRAEGADAFDVPEAAPFCASCGASLQQSLRYREVLATAERGPGRVFNRIAFCGSCGVAISATQRFVGDPGGPRRREVLSEQVDANEEVADPEEANTLAGQFQLRCREVVEETKALGYISAGSVPMLDRVSLINRLGAVRAAQVLMRRDRVLNVTRWLVERGRPDLTIEWEVLQSRWNDLFTDDERAAATTHLRDLGTTGPSG